MTASLLPVNITTAALSSGITLVAVPAPATNQVQGMITSVGVGRVQIDNLTVTHDGDTVMNFYGGLTALAIGEIVNYSFTVDVDGVILATVMDIYPAQSVTNTERVSAINVDNGTSIVSLTLAGGRFVDFYQGSGIYVSGAGTNTSYGTQLVNYTGFINPTTGHIIASTSGYMSDIPLVLF